MNIVYTTPKKAKWGESLKYSIRSVRMYHPEASITVIGYKPTYYEGKMIYKADKSICPYVNQWEKVEEACKEYDEFYLLDAQTFLIGTIDPILYYNGELEDKPETYKKIWPGTLENTQKELPPSRNYYRFAPMPVNSKNFLEFAKRFPDRKKHPSLLPRQVYGYFEDRWQERQIYNDLYYRSPESIDLSKNFFYTYAEDNIMKKFIRAWYQEETTLELT